MASDGAAGDVFGERVALSGTARGDRGGFQESRHGAAVHLPLII